MPEQPTTLRDMIEQALNSGVTYRQLEARATDPISGTTISRGTLNKIALGRIPTMPGENKLRAVAAALRAPYESVRQAAIAQWAPPTPDTDADAERIAQIAELRRLRDEADAALKRLEGPSRRAG